MASFQGTKINPTEYHKSQIKFFIIMIPVAILMLLPILFIFNHAFKPRSELFAFPPKFFVRQPTFDNFRELVTIANASSIPFSRYLLNSIFVTSIGVLLTLAVTSLSAYALSKLKFRGKRLLFEINTIALMFVSSAVGITRYLVIARLGLIDNFFCPHLTVTCNSCVDVFN